MTFGKKLQWQRKKNGLSQESLAEALNVSRQAVSKWEQDGALPDAANIVRIAKLFSVTTDYLLMDEIEEESERPSAFPPPAPAPLPPKKSHTILSIISVSLGSLGHFVIYILSRFIEVRPLQALWIKDGLTYYEQEPVPVRDYPAFVSVYRLDNLCTFFTLLILAGAAYLLWKNRNAIRTRFTKKHSK
ncbi:MAG: helix-turn-helix transcriptional regulator [Clostridia bacterium]|nr:helix-turn-helix transcriptional regulator [Clostridia bacterium]